MGEGRRLAQPAPHLRPVPVLRFDHPAGREDRVGGTGLPVRRLGSDAHRRGRRILLEGHGRAGCRARRPPRRSATRSRPGGRSDHHGPHSSRVRRCRADGAQQAQGRPGSARARDRAVRSAWPSRPGSCATRSSPSRTTLSCSRTPGSSSGSLGLVVGIGGSVLFFYFLNLVHRGAFRRGSREELIPYAFLLPGFSLIALFLLYPTVQTIIYSFANDDSTAWVGLDNYEAIFSMGDFWSDPAEQLPVDSHRPGGERGLRPRGRSARRQALPHGENVGEVDDFPPDGDQLRGRGDDLGTGLRLRTPQARPKPASSMRSVPRSAAIHSPGIRSKPRD